MPIVNAWALRGNSTNQAGGTNGTDTSITYTNDYASFDGTNSIITCGTAIQPWTSDFVVTMVLRSTNTANIKILIGNNNGGNYYQFTQRYTAAGRFWSEVFANVVTADANSWSGKWIVASFCRLSNVSAIFVNGKKYAWSSVGVNSGTGWNTVIGWRPFDASFRYLWDLKNITHTTDTLRDGAIVNYNLLYKWFF